MTDKDSKQSQFLAGTRFLRTLSYAEVQEQYPAAWQGLPECYRQDTCLTFFLDLNENLCAVNDSNQEFMWCGVKGWVEIPQA